MIRMYVVFQCVMCVGFLFHWCQIWKSIRRVALRFLRKMIDYLDRFPSSSCFVVLFIPVLQSKASNTSLSIGWSECKPATTISTKKNTSFQGLRTYQYAVQCQQDWKNLSHVSISLLRHVTDTIAGTSSRFLSGKCSGVMCKNVLDLSFGSWSCLFNRLLRQWREASVMAETLLNENNWSKATYSYMLGTCLFEENNGVANEQVIEAYKWAVLLSHLFMVGHWCVRF